MASRDVNFLTFFLIWAKLQGWKVPLLHVRICQWLDTCDARVRVLMVFRGAAKSTIYAVWKAYRLYKNQTNRSLIYAADDKLAGKLTRDTLAVLRRHRLCAGMLPRNPGALSFWVNGATDARNPSMEAVGVNSNATGSRADDADFDDIEVPKNIKTPDARQQIRQKIEETTHIMNTTDRKQSERLCCAGPLAVAALAILLMGCSRGATKGTSTTNAPPPSVVRVAAAATRDIPMELRTFGSVEASASATLQT